MPILALLIIALALGGCNGSASPPPAPTAKGTLLLAVTTSTHDSGLLAVILPPFETAQNVTVDVLPVGSGKALELARRGDVDAVIVHDAAAEEAFMKAGHGRRREEFMVNYFLIAGPTDDPAGIKDLEPALALARIAERGAAFISRGDESGTHKRALALWAATPAARRPEWPGYLASGQGMGATLLMADEKKAYTLVDAATFRSFALKGKILAPLVTKGESLRNPYSILIVNPERHPKTRFDLAERLADDLIGPATQTRIRDYTREGAALFTPLRLKGKD